MFQNAFSKSSRDIYTASSFARSSLLYLQEIGTLSALQPHGSARENLGSYLFFLVTEGAGMLEYLTLGSDTNVVNLSPEC